MIREYYNYLQQTIPGEEPQNITVTIRPVDN